MSTAHHGSVHISSFDLSSATHDAGGVGVGTPALDEDGSEIAALSANGLLTYKPSSCSAITIASGSVVKAIRPLYSDGSTKSAADYAAQGGTLRKLAPLLLRAVDAGWFVLEHDAAPPVDEWAATERIACQYGRDVVFANAYTYVQWDYVSGARRWLCADWGSFTGDASNFATAPTSINQAIERIAAAVSGLLLGPIPD